MSNFIDYGFPATGASAARTLPARLAEVKNVKDFGAKGDGVTDDWAAIDAACNWNPDGDSGTIFFPPGTYVVSQAINLTGRTFNITGIIGASIIIGDFAAYILKRDDPVGNTSNLSTIENLTIINQHATGGGIRMGLCSTGAIRNCSVTANQGISNAIDDTVSPLTSIDFSIDNCTVSPGSNVSGSNGIMAVCDGPIYNCRVVGFETGMRLWGNQGGWCVRGCYFEQNVVGIDVGTTPGGAGSIGIGSLSGCWFKDNGTAIKFSTGAGGGYFCGIRIEASESVTVGGARPQYGIYIDVGRAGGSLFSGIIVTGQFDQYGIYYQDQLGAPTIDNNIFIGVQSLNTSSHGGQAWHKASATAGSATFIECNGSAPVYTVAHLPTAIPPLEGDCYNVSDSNSSIWGATAAGGGSTNAKVRWNGSAWSVVGK